MSASRRITGLELRDRVANGYQRRMGLERGQAEALAAADLTIVDAAALGRDVTAKAKRKKPERKATTVQEQAAIAGVAIANQATDRRPRPDVLYAKATELGERYSHMAARLLRICETGEVCTASAMVDIAKDAALPTLAQEYLEVWSNFMLRRGGDGPQTRIGFNRGSFATERRHDDRDARRKFVRLCEDICDRSVRWLGPWWVK